VSSQCTETELLVLATGLAMIEHFTRSECLPNSDNIFGPRVPIDCRDFDFTFLFEDAILILPPAAIFLLLIPGRIGQLIHHPVRRLFHGVGVCKIVSTNRKTAFLLLTPRR
jgi:hypothetical protein